MPLNPLTGLLIAYLTAATTDTVTKQLVNIQPIIDTPWNQLATSPTLSPLVGNIDGPTYERARAYIAQDPARANSLVAGFVTFMEDAGAMGGAPPLWSGAGPHPPVGDLNFLAGKLVA